VLFLDDDDRLHPAALGRLREALARHPDVFAAVGARQAFDADGRHRYPFPRWPLVRSAWREVLAGWVATPGQMLVRTKFLRDAGGWSAAAVPAEDLALWLHAADTPAAFVPATVLEYRIHSGPRPAADIEGIEAGLRAGFVAGCDAAKRTEAERLVQAHGAIRAANAAFDAGEPRAAARSLVTALRLSPSLVVSPILGPSLLGSLAKASSGVVLGQRGWSAARRATRRARRATGRTRLPS
jgi:hypothetical protein